MLESHRTLMISVPLVALLAACAVAAPTPTPTSAPTATPTLTLTPSPTFTPSPTPTATPIPPMRLEIRWPNRVSALEPVTVEVALIPPAGVEAEASVSARVRDPVAAVRWSSELTPRPPGDLYVAQKPLRLPLEPLDGDWRLEVDVQAELAVEGTRRLTFRPDAIPLRDLTGSLPPGVAIRVPQAFFEAGSRGDRVAGGRVWRYENGEVALWWAPGPAEPLLLNNAIVMLESSHDPYAPPEVLDVEERTWEDQPAFLFREAWHGTASGPAEALVVQTPDYRLYVLRIRALGSETIPPLLHEVRKTFTFVDQGE